MWAQGCIDRLEGRILPCSHTSKVQEVTQVPDRTGSFDFVAFSFGLKTTPAMFTRVVKVVARATGTQLHQYLGDWLVVHKCRDTLVTHTKWLLDLPV